jgi:hypothetical protein
MGGHVIANNLPEQDFSAVKQRRCPEWDIAFFARQFEYTAYPLWELALLAIAV